MFQQALHLWVDLRSYKGSQVDSCVGNAAQMVARNDGDAKILPHSLSQENIYGHL